MNSRCRIRPLSLLLVSATVGLSPLAAQPAEPASDEVVQLDAFQVSTSIGRYHEETSSMATKIPTNLKELSSSLEILNANAISDRNAITLQDIYSYVVGMNQVSPNGNGFTFRGFSNTGTFTQNIQFDGLMGATSSKGAVSAANVESVEFLKGPNSVLYGQMHPGGLLNIVSKSPMATRQVAVSASIGTYAGTYNNFGGSLSYTQSIDATGPIDAAKHWSYRVVVAGQELRPWRPGDYDRDFYLYPSLTYQWNQESYITVKLEDVQEKRRADDGLIPLANDVGQAAPPNTMYQELSDTQRDQGQALAVVFKASLGQNWFVRLQTRSVWHRDLTHELTQKGVKITAAANPANTTIARQYNYIDNGHRYNYFDANLVGSDLGPKNFKHTLLFGVGGGDEFFDNARKAFGPNVAPTSFYHPGLGFVTYPADGTGIQNTVQTIDSLGEYISDQMKIGERVHLSVGGRHDQQGSHGVDTLNPTKTPYAHQFVTSNTYQGGVVYDLSRALSVYASYSQSFVPNSVTTVDSAGNSNFPSETGTQVETGLKFETADQRLFGSVAVYRIDRSNVAVGTGQTIQGGPLNGVAYFRLDGSQRGEGVEFETEWLPMPNWQVQAGVALSKATITGSTLKPLSIGKDLVNSPRKSGNFWTRYNVPNGPLKGLGFGLGLIYVGPSWGGDPANPPVAGTNTYFIVPGWTRVDTSYYLKWRRYDFALNVQNLLDRKYFISATNITQLLPGDARKLTLSIRTSF